MCACIHLNYSILIYLFIFLSIFKVSSREDILSRFLTENKLDNEIESIFIEINLRSKKWVVSFSYNPKLSHIKKHLEKIGEVL